jgi:hypothetical protein
MDWTVDRGLQLRMAVTLLATAALAVLGAVVTYAVVRGLVVLLAAVSGDEWLGSLVAAGHDRPVAAVIAVVFLAGVVVAEHRLGRWSASRPWTPAPPTASRIPSCTPTWTDWSHRSASRLRRSP